MVKLNDIILNAIRVSLETNKGYVEKVLGERNPTSPTQAGSSFLKDFTLDELLSTISLAEVQEVNMGSERFLDCLYFRIPVGGTVGVVDLRSLDQELKVDLLDPKQTLGTKGGSVECYLRDDQSNIDRSQVDFTTIILGREEGQPYALWSIFPGPVVPRPVPVGDATLLGKTVTVAEARNLGFVVAKVTR